VFLKTWTLNFQEKDRQIKPGCGRATMAVMRLYSLGECLDMTNHPNQTEKNKFYRELA